MKAIPIQGAHPVSTTIPAFDLSRIALLLDVDGTLLDLADKPDAVCVPPDLRAALNALAQCPLCAIALVSGRSAAQLDALFSPMKLPLAGCHGAEIREHPDAPIRRRAMLSDDARRDLNALAAQFPGVLIEDKGVSIALHYRAVPALEAPLLAAAEQFVAENTELELLMGKAVIEFKPRGYDKATACAELLSHPPFKGRTPVFIGDDVTDQRVFHALPQFSGIGISVGRPMEGAKFMLASPAAVRSWLGGLALDGVL